MEVEKAAERLKNYRKLRRGKDCYEKRLRKLRVRTGSKTDVFCAQRRLEKLRRLLAREEAFARSFIRRATDPVARAALEARYLGMKSWTAAAFFIGGGITPDGARKICEREIEKICLSAYGAKGGKRREKS